MKPNQVILYEPQESDAEAVWSFRASCQQKDGEHIPGSAGLGIAESFDMWLQSSRERYIAKDTRMVPSTVFLAKRISDNALIGIVDIRHTLDDHLRFVGGHIGYTVAPQFRRHGYGTKILGAALSHCKQLGLKRALVTCDKTNLGSAGVILANGGVLENEVVDNSRVKQRYWIEIK
ncbi:GNAT family N-acetyltransferase [Candidatus Saccharibacteria bacterium]|nr:MAG: GNAT family N-acetyltransferase [Candidatus Saccharibacteria bacterium]